MADLVLHKLSPATKAVVIAFTNDPDWMRICEEERVSLAAALRAVADHLNDPTSAHTLYAIAAELEAQ